MNNNSGLEILVIVNEELTDKIKALLENPDGKCGFCGKHIITDVVRTAEYRIMPTFATLRGR